ncbi:MAG TPA: hypothetical protein VHB18_09625 [Mycobacteriales bacterium]|jgi:hypothetical protein|nr:hypothetical protein [Mycobacteriales bacterium]
MMRRSRSEERALGLLRWYPRSWRARYGEEFAALLIADIDEHPSALRRDLNVRWHGAKARLAAAGLAPGLRDGGAARSARALAIACFLACTTSLWAHVLNASSSAPTAHPPVVAMRIVIGATFGFLCLQAGAGLVGLTRRTGRAVRDDAVRHLAPALLTVGIGVAVFTAGLVAVWSQLRYGITFASVTQITTLSLSHEWSYVGQLPDWLLGWMVMSPLAFLAIAGGLAQLQRHLPAPRIERNWPWQTALLGPTWLVALWWGIASQDYRMPPLRAGWLDQALLIVMALCLLVAAAAERVPGIPLQE